MTEGYELAFVIGGLFLSLSAFSLIFGDNYLFRLGTAILSGAVSAYICVLLTESYFYPLILDIINGRANLTTAQILRLALVTIGVILLFMKIYTGSKSGGKIIFIILMSISAVVLVIGAAGGTIPAYVRSIAGQFRLAAIPSEEKSNVWYWVKAVTVLVSAITALLFTRHYDISRKKTAGNKTESVFGNILIGFTFGAIAAAVFITAANILVNHISELLDSFRALGR